MKRGRRILKFLVLGTVGLLVIGLVTQGLWNWLVPGLFAGPTLTFWQAIGLLALTKILFWSFGRGPGHWRSRYSGPRGYYWKDQWNKMTPEERERFKQKMQEKWCYPDKTTSSGDSTTSAG